MLSKIKSFLATVVLISAFSTIANASHISGGEVTYKSMGGMQYKVIVTFYWDCSAFDPGTTVSMQTFNNGGFNDQFFTVNMDSTSEISQLCPSSLGNSTCNGGILPGNKRNCYSAIITLPGVCSQWTFATISTCCRNSSTNAPGSAESFILYATLNNQAAPNNNSPYCTSQPLPYLCVGQTVCYSPGVVEQDGNSLSFAFVDAMGTTTTTPITYGAGFSGSSPMPGLTILPGNGLMQFTPTAIGNYVVVFQVTERDANGIVVGTVIRDVEMVVVNCTNQVVSCNAGAVTNLVGYGAVIIPPNGVQVCENVPFSFSFSFTDPDPADILSITSNITQVMPGSTITTTGTNPITINVSWNAPVGTANTFTTFAVTVSDNACPVTGQQTVNYIMMILPATYAGPDVTICQNTPDTLHGSGPGTHFNWTVLSGAPMVLSGPGQNFSCDTCQNPIATPNITTTYILFCSGAMGCVLVDTVTIFVVPDFTYNISQSSPNSCLLDPVQLSVNSVTPGNPANYTYLWSPATNLSNPNIANPTATFSSPGTYSYNVTITSPQGCVKHNTVSIAVAPAFAPLITVSNDTSFCTGTATLNVDFNSGGIPAVCGISPTGGCGGAALVGTVGTGLTSNGTSSGPAPFYNYYTSGISQFLYTAAELNAAGIIGGKIDQLDYNITDMNTAAGAISTYHEFTIKIGCTNLTTFNTSSPTFSSGLFTVFPAQTVTAAAGWNTFAFANAYEWDGISNIIVEVCFSEGYNCFATSFSCWTDNLSSTNTATAYTSSIWALSDSQDQCTTQTGWIQTAMAHPDMRLHYCSIIPDPADYTYNWVSYPAGGNIANDTLMHTTGTPVTVTDYVITVTNNSGGCHTIDTVHVGLTNIGTMNITPVGPFCTGSPAITLQVSVPIGTGYFHGPGITDTLNGVFDPSIAIGYDTIHYTVNAGPCGTGDTTIVIHVATTLDPTIAVVPPVCTSTPPITLTAATAGGSWSGYGITDTLAGTFNPALPGLVGYDSITYTIYTPCYSRDTILISVTQQQDATINPLPAGNYCIGTLPFFVTSIGTGINSSWAGPGIDAATGLFNPYTAGAGTHRIYHYMNGFCGDLDSVDIVVNPTPVISISSDVSAGCAPITVNFTSTNDQPGGSCFWDFGNGSSSTACNSSSTYTSYNGGVPYNVTYIYTSPMGCADTVTNTGMISIYSQPVAIFTATPQPTDITAPEITFIDQSTGVINNWYWTFGTGAGSILQNPTYTYADSGTYYVQLLVVNNNGCKDSTHANVIIDPILTCYIPTGFTPDGNGNNDEFRVMGTDIQNEGFEMSIFDRWGERVFYSNNIEIGWNGAKHNMGAVLEMGAYVYKINLRDWKGLEHEYIGHVTIVK